MTISVSEYFTMFPRTKIDSADINITYMPLAKGWVESKLAPAFSIPFSSNNLTYKQLTYYKIQHMVLLRTRDPDDSDELGDELDKWIRSLVSGSASMITTSQEAIYAGDTNASQMEIVSGNTGNYHSVFDMDNPFSQNIDEDRLDDIEADRK